MKGKKVIVFVGSPRKSGNTATLVKQVLKGAEDRGCNIKIYHLNEMNIKGCQSCMYCRKHEGCAVNDDMQKIYDDIKDADTLIIGSPIYIHQVSGQTKILLDRFYPLTDEKHKPRFGKKKLIMIYTQAAPFKFIFRKYIKYMNNIFKPMGLEVYKNIIATKCFEPDIAANNKKLLQEAYETGKSLF